MDWRCLKNNETLMSRERPWALTAAGPISLVEAHLNRQSTLRRLESGAYSQCRQRSTKQIIHRQSRPYIPNLTLLNQCTDPSDAIVFTRTSVQDNAPIEVMVTNDLAI
jgi:hypothetical protein